MVPGLVDVLRNPATLQRMWQNAMGMIKKANPAHAVLFFNTRPVLDAEKGVLIIELDAANAFAANALQKPEVQSELQQCLDAAAGAPVVFRFQKKDGAAGGGFGAAPVPATPAVAPAPAAVLSSAASVPAPATVPPAAASVPAVADSAASVETPPWDQPPVPPAAPSASAPASQPPASVPVPSAAPSSAVSVSGMVPSPATPAPAAVSVPLAATPTVPHGADDGEEASADELNSILAGAFGEGVMFTEE